MTAREDTLLRTWEAALDERLAALDAAAVLLDEREGALKERETAVAVEEKRRVRQGLEYSFSYWKVVAGLTLRDEAIHQQIAKQVTHSLAMRRTATVTATSASSGELPLAGPGSVSQRMWRSIGATGSCCAPRRGGRSGSIWRSACCTG